MTSATLDRSSAPATIRSAQRPARPVPPTLPKAGVRLTRRGRLVLVSLVALVILAVTLVGAASAFAGTSGPSAPATTTVVVQPGQTLWELAVQVAPDADPRDVVKRISDLNGLESPLVAPGQSLVVPAS